MPTDLGWMDQQMVYRLHALMIGLWRGWQRIENTVDCLMGSTDGRRIYVYIGVYIRNIKIF